MGFLDELKKLTKPYADEEEDYDDYDDATCPHVPRYPPQRYHDRSSLLPQFRAGYRPHHGKPHREYQHHDPAPGGPGEAGAV